MQDRVCGQDEVERVVLNVSSGFVIVWEDEMSAAVANIRDKYPSVQQIVLQPVVGAPDANGCFFGNAEVRASENHPIIAAAIDNIAGGDVVAGLAPTVGDCSHYSDQQGHLTVPAGGESVAAQVDDFYTNVFESAVGQEDEVY